MKPTRILSLVALAFLFGGCLPAPKRVFIDLNQVKPTREVSAVRISSATRGVNSLSLSGQVAGRGERVLEEREGAALWEEAKQTLSKNRASSLQRLRADLERKYVGESRAKAIEAERLAETADDLAWEEALRQSRLLMDNYAGEKTALNAELASYIGFPDDGQSVPKIAREEVFLDRRKEQVSKLRDAIEVLDKAFRIELGQVLTAYDDERRSRLDKILDDDLAGDREALARADAEAEAAIQRVIGQVNSAIPSLQKRLEALETVAITGESAQVMEPEFGFESISEGLARSEIEKYVNVFVKSRGYELGSRARPEDVTEEFKEWLEKNAVTR